MTCSKSFLLEKLTMVLPLCFLKRWHASILSSVMSTPVCWSILHTIDSGSLSLIDECISIDDICLDRILLTFLTTETSRSRFWKFSFKRLISAVSEAIIALVCSLVLKNKSIIWYLFNPLSVSSIHTLAIMSTSLLQWQKMPVK